MKCANENAKKKILIKHEIINTMEMKESYKTILYLMLMLNKLKLKGVLFIFIHL
jgi:hypothetical protein